MSYVLLAAALPIIIIVIAIGLLSPRRPGEQFRRRHYGAFVLAGVAVVLVIIALAANR